MIVGDVRVLAIESEITEAYERLSLRGLGFFVLHVGGSQYGVNAPDATMLANSFDEIQRRISSRGSHAAAFATEPDAAMIAYAYQRVIWAGESKESFFGIPAVEFSNLIYSRDLAWAPDGDEAFDDGSRVLQFDVQDRVRLIAFKSGENYPYLHEPATLRDVTMEAGAFYEILARWRDAFEREWASLPKCLSEPGGSPSSL